MAETSVAQETAERVGIEERAFDTADSFRRAAQVALEAVSTPEPRTILPNAERQTDEATEISKQGLTFLFSMVHTLKVGEGGRTYGPTMYRYSYSHNGKHSDMISEFQAGKLYMQVKRRDVGDINPADTETLHNTHILLGEMDHAGYQLSQAGERFHPHFRLYVTPRDVHVIRDDETERAAARANIEPTAVYQLLKGIEGCQPHDSTQAA